MLKKLIKAVRNLYRFGKLYPVLTHDEARWLTLVATTHSRNYDLNDEGQFEFYATKVGVYFDAIGIHKYDLLPEGWRLLHEYVEMTT